MPHRHLVVTLRADAPGPVNGRLLVFTRRAEESGKQAATSIADMDEFEPSAMSVAACDVHRLEPGSRVDIDLDELAFPKGFSQLQPGRYLIQALLDTNGDYTHFGRGAGDLESPAKVVTVGDATTLPVFALGKPLPERDPWQLPSSWPQWIRDSVPAARANAHPMAFVSSALSAFWGRPMTMRGWVLTPRGYDPSAPTTYPTVYYFGSYGGSMARSAGEVAQIQALADQGALPPMIWVFPDESLASGNHVFADSVNNGPWATALVGELIPYLEMHYRMDAKPAGRFVTGHSSGGWASLWLQVRYPATFGGTWSTAPDPIDFHDFLNTDLYTAHANVYRRPDGSSTPVVREHGQAVMSMRESSQLERVLGKEGGQMNSFEWVFSPRGADGRPQPLFDRDTGAVDPAVAREWIDHYDIVRQLQREWPTKRSQLHGKLHVIVGDEDTYYLDGPVALLKQAMDAMHASSDIRFIPGRNHNDLYSVGDDRAGLLKRIGWEMYEVARPGTATKVQSLSGAR
ncbi:MAG: alpha/beta hydrolase-fold protein [Rhodanobacter sp.]